MEDQYRERSEEKEGAPPPPAPTGPEPLPAGWTASVDPSSGRTYYVGPGGQTSWEKPQQAPAPPPMPPPPPPGEPSMPPGWTSSVDPSGRDVLCGAGRRDDLEPGWREGVRER